MPGLSLRLGLGLNRQAAAAALALAPSAPVLIALSAAEVADSAANGTAIGQFLTAGGTAPYSYALTSDPSGLLTIAGDSLEVAGSFSGKSSYDFAVEVTDANGLTLGQAFTLAVSASIDNGSGISSGDGDVVPSPDPSDPGSDTGGFVTPPVQVDTSDGLKLSGKNGGSATFFKDLGAPKLDHDYIMRWTADWSGMSKLGRQAAVGFAFKAGNDFHLVALRGNGAPDTRMLDSRIYGDFRKTNQFTVTNDATAAHGSKDGPNWLKIRLSADGATYTLSSSADGASWTVEENARVPAPLATAGAALQFGPGGYFTNQDKGVFSITLETFEGLYTARQAALPGLFVNATASRQSAIPGLYLNE